MAAMAKDEEGKAEARIAIAKFNNKNPERWILPMWPRACLIARSAFGKLSTGSICHASAETQSSSGALPIASKGAYEFRRNECFLSSGHSHSE